MLWKKGKTPSIPETPHLEPENGASPPEDGAVGIATRVEGKEVMTQTAASPLPSDSGLP